MFHIITQDEKVYNHLLIVKKNLSLQNILDLHKMDLKHMKMQNHYLNILVTNKLQEKKRLVDLRIYKMKYKKWHQKMKNYQLQEKNQSLVICKIHLQLFQQMVRSLIVLIVQLKLLQNLVLKKYKKNLNSRQKFKLLIKNKKMPARNIGFNQEAI